MVVDEGSGARDKLETVKIRGAIDRLNATHPDFVPVQVEAARAEWLRISGGFGLVSASRSFLPVFLELQKKAPEYSKSYILAARAYIFVGASLPLVAAMLWDPARRFLDRLTVLSRRVPTILGLLLVALFSPTMLRASAP